jgi:hypothetical protein
MKMNLPGNYPVADNWLDSTGILTSYKTIDLQAYSYQNPETLQGMLDRYSDRIGNFSPVNWGGAELQNVIVNERQLVVGIPSSPNPLQAEAIQKAADYAKSIGVNLSTVVWP